MEPQVKRIRQEVASSHTGWFDLPSEMRSMVLNKMSFRDSINFARCSKQCSEEVWASRKYFKEIHLIEGKTLFRMQFVEIETHGKYAIDFLKCESSLTEVVFKRYTDSEEGNTVKLYENTNDVVLRFLQGFLKRIGRNLRSLTIYVRNPMRNRLIRNIKLRNLEKLVTLKLASSYSQICPLKWGFIDMEQLSYVKNHLEIPGMRMTLEKLVQLKAKNIECQYTDLTPDDLNKYIKLWLDGELHDNFEMLTIDDGTPEKGVKRKIELNLDGLHTEYYKRQYTDLNFCVESELQMSKGLMGSVLLTCGGELFRFTVCNENYM